MNDFYCIWLYKSKVFKSKKQLKQENRLSTTKFLAKLRDKEIIKLPAEQTANGSTEITI